MPRKTRAERCGSVSVLRGRFNEAAARCRGKQVEAARADGARAASMRPRPDAAENGGWNDDDGTD